MLFEPSVSLVPWFVFRGAADVLFGGDGLGEVPQLEGVVLGHGDQAGLDGMEGQRSHAIKVAPQRVLGVPGLPERRVLIGWQLR